MMTHKQLIECLAEAGLLLSGGARPGTGSASEYTVSCLTERSQRIAQGAVFVAVNGGTRDGHDFAPEAAARGAVAILGERRGISECAGVPYIAVTDARKAAGVLSHALAAHPSRGMTVIGVTGTNGKSSTVLLTQSVLRHAGRATSSLGTLGCDIAGTRTPLIHTTPFAEDLAALFAKAKAADTTHMVMEVSSHALDQERVAGILFQVAAFTNLTRDHLDYHGDMDAYRDAKLRLFERADGFVVVNADDPNHESFMKASAKTCYTFGERGQCRAENIEIGAATTRFTLATPWGASESVLRLLGPHNVANALCAAAICGGLGVAVDVIAEGLADLRSIPGRFEAIDAGQDFHVVVDYAHTEDALRNVLNAARQVCAGRLIAVFGCGGDRDKGKRPKMGAAAAELADFALLTSDNPRTEDPHRILLDVEVGLQRGGGRKGEQYRVIENREEAIRQAIAMAEPGDFVLIAGKGHEDYQILETQRIHFDDREVARGALEEG